MRVHGVITGITFGLGLLIALATVVTQGGAAQAAYKLAHTWGGPRILKSPRGVAVNGRGQVFVADASAGCVVVFSANGTVTGKIKTRYEPLAVATDKANNLYVAEAGSNAGIIVKYSPDGMRMKSWNYPGAKNAWSDADTLSYQVGGMAIAGEYLYLGNSAAGRINQFTLDGKLVRSWGRFSTCCDCLDVAADAKGYVYVAELGTKKVVKYDSAGKRVMAWGKAGQGNGQFPGCCNPVNIAVAPDGTILTAEKGSPRIQRFTADGKFVASLGKGLFSSACGSLDLAVSPNGTIYALDDGACKLLVFTPTHN